MAEKKVKEDTVHIPETDFERLVKQYNKTQKPEIFQQLYEASYRPVYRYIISIGRNEQLTEEAIQKGYVICYEKIGQLEDGSKFVPWLKTICYREYISLVKKQKKDLSTNLQDEEGNDEENNTLVNTDVMQMPEDAAAQRELKTLLINTINTLPDGQRIAIMRFYYDNIPVKNIADELGVPENTIKSYLSRGRKTMGKKIGAFANAYGLKMVTIATVPFIAGMFKSEVEASGLTVTGKMVSGSYAAFTAAVNHGAVTSGAATAGTGSGIGAKAGASKAAGAAVKTAAGAGAKTGTVKVVAGVTAAAVACGGTAAFIKNSHHEDPAAVTTTAEPYFYQPYEDLMAKQQDGYSYDLEGYYRLYDIDDDGTLELFLCNGPEESFTNSSGQEVWSSNEWTVYTISDGEAKELGIFGGIRTNNDILDTITYNPTDYLPYAQTPVLVHDKDGGYIEYLYQNGKLTETYEMSFPSQQGAGNGVMSDPDGNQVLSMDTWSLRYNGYASIQAIDHDEFVNVTDYHYQDFLDYLKEKDPENYEE